MVISVKAYAKINVALNVYGIRNDGYHEVDMVMLPIALHDILEIEKMPYGYETFIMSDDASLPTDESNSTTKAFLKFREVFDLKDNFLINIYKRIPMSAGLGGGSADAAAVIKTILKHGKINLSDEEIVQYCKSIGADVPFCYYNKPARCRGVGEKMNFFSIKGKYYVLLIKPQEGVSTIEAYKMFDELKNKDTKSNIERLIEALKNGDDKVVAEEMKNDLQVCALKKVPEIKYIIDTLKNDGFDMTMMSGSGSTVFALCRDKKALEKEMKKFDQEKYKVILTNTL